MVGPFQHALAKCPKGTIALYDEHTLSLSDWVIPLPRGVCGGHRNFLFHQALDASTTSLLTSGLHVERNRVFITRCSAISFLLACTRQSLFQELEEKVTRFHLSCTRCRAPCLFSRNMPIIQMSSGISRVIITFDHMEMNSAFVGNAGHFDNKIGLDGSEGLRHESRQQQASCQPDFFGLVILVLVCPSPMLTSTAPRRRASKVSRLHDRHGKDWFFASLTCTIRTRASVSKRRQYFSRTRCGAQTPLHRNRKMITLLSRKVALSRVDTTVSQLVGPEHCSPESTRPGVSTVYIRAS